MTSIRSFPIAAIAALTLLLCGNSGLAQGVADQETAPPEPAAPAASQSTSPALVAPHITPGPSITLEEALRLADERNLTLESARLEVDKAQAMLKQSYALILPALQASMTLQERDHADTFNFADSLPPSLAGMAAGMGDTVLAPRENLAGALQAGMTLINAQSWLTIGAAKKGVEAAELSVEDGRQQLLLGVSLAFYYSLMSRSLFSLYEEQVRSAQHHLDVSKARFEAGTGLKIDVIRADTDLQSAQQDLLNAVTSYDKARDALGELIGSRDLPEPVEAEIAAPPTGTDAEIVDGAVAKRSDIAAQRAIIGAMEKSLDAAWMQFLPSLNAAWQLQYQFTAPGDMGSSDRSRWAFVFTLSVPIYNHYRYGDLDAKRAALRQAMINEENKTTHLGVEVRNARRDYLTALAANEIAERKVELAKEGLALVEASYEAGTGTSLDVTDAQRTLSAANVNFVATRLQAQIALLSLLRSAGRDMQDVSSGGPTRDGAR
jgi:outer membrane protein